MSIFSQDILKNYHHILHIIDQHKNDYQLLDTHETRLMVVTKTQTIDDIRILLKAGHRLFGENRVQEAYEKFPPLIQEYPDIELHLIGPLQSNKFKDAIALFHTIQSIDRLKLLELLAREQSQNHPIPQFYLQVNIGEEPQKAGIYPHSFADLYQKTKLLNLMPAGLMCVPPAEKTASPYFALLAKIAKEYNVPRLSMGMSSDFGDAIAMGSHIIRIGSLIFGARNNPPPLT